MAIQDPQNISASRWSSHRVLLFSASLLFIGGCEKKEAAPPPPPPVVRVADVIQQDVPVYSEWVAQLNGDINAEITPKVQGYVLTKNYQEGFAVARTSFCFPLIQGLFRPL